MTVRQQRDSSAALPPSEPVELPSRIAYPGGDPEDGRPAFIHLELRAYRGLCDKLCLEGAMAPACRIGELQ